MKNIALKILGSMAFALGVMGVFLPLLPTTCFMLLSAWAFSRSSPKFYQWLYYRSPFANSIQSWQQHKIVPRKVKVIATLSIVFSLVISSVLISSPVIVTSLAVGLSMLLAYLWTREDENSIGKSANLERNHGWRQQVS